MNAHVAALDDARPTETADLPPITGRVGPASVAPVRNKRRGRALLLILALVSVGLAGYTMIKGRLAQGGFGFRAAQDTAPKPDPVKILQDRVAELEIALRTSDDSNQLTWKVVTGEINTLRDSLTRVASADDQTALRTLYDGLSQGVDKHAKRLTLLEGAEQVRRQAQVERVQQQEIRAREEPATLPFRVLALDRWGGKPYVTVAPPGVNVLETMGVGDKRAGWELKDVDARGGNVTFIDQTGHRVTKTVEER